MIYHKFVSRKLTYIRYHVQEDHSLFWGGPSKGPKCQLKDCPSISSISEVMKHQMYCYNLLMSCDHHWSLLQPPTRWVFESSSKQDFVHDIFLPFQKLPNFEFSNVTNPGFETKSGIFFVQVRCNILQATLDLGAFFGEIILHQSERWMFLCEGPTQQRQVFSTMYAGDLAHCMRTSICIDIYLL